MILLKMCRVTTIPMNTNDNTRTVVGPTFNLSEPGAKNMFIPLPDEPSAAAFLCLNYKESEINDRSKTHANVPLAGIKNFRIFANE